MDIDIHITNATPEDIKKTFQAISGSKERQDVYKNILAHKIDDESLSEPTKVTTGYSMTNGENIPKAKIGDLVFVYSRRKKSTNLVGIFRRLF